MPTKPTKPFARELSDAHLMCKALKAYTQRVQGRGLKADFVDKLKEYHDRALALNSEQEKLKADLKTKTQQLNDQMELLRLKYREIKKIVKLEFPQEQWVEFGIQDKR